jgi:hypothetical protein
LNDIEKILNHDFLIQIVSIESIKFDSSSDTTNFATELISIIELKIIVIEPTTEKNRLSENIYDLKLTKVTCYKIDFNSSEEKNLEFDTDEVTLEKHPKNIGSYTLKFFNASTNINITFSELTMNLLSFREFI